MVESGTSIGTDFVVTCCNSVYIGKDVLIAARCYVADGSHRYEDVTRPVIDQGMTNGTLRIEEGAWIGINVVIHPNVRIGKHAVVGANSVVIRDVPDFTVVTGNPAKAIKRYDLQTGIWVQS